MSKLAPPWYTTFFDDDYLRAYEPMLTMEQTESEVAFVVYAMSLSPGERLLDLGCGQGRHAILLAKHGIQVTAQDLSAAYLESARASAQDQEVILDLVHNDIRQIPFENTFDVVMSISSPIGYLESREEDVAALAQVTRALKSDGRLLLDMPNREWVLTNALHTEWDVDRNDTMYLRHQEFDLVTSRHHIYFTIVSPDGSKKESTAYQARLYTLTEMIHMLEQTGITFVGVYGGYDGEAYSGTTQRMILVGRKRS